jgi:hypothetical protein
MAKPHEGQRRQTGRRRFEIFWRQCSAAMELRGHCESRLWSNARVPLSTTPYRLSRLYECDCTVCGPPRSSSSTCGDNFGTHPLGNYTNARFKLPPGLYYYMVAHC